MVLQSNCWWHVTNCCRVELVVLKQKLNEFVWGIFKNSRDKNGMTLEIGVFYLGGTTLHKRTGRTSRFYCMFSVSLDTPLIAPDATSWVIPAAPKTVNIYPPSRRCKWSGEHWRSLESLGERIPSESKILPIVFQQYFLQRVFFTFSASFDWVVITIN